MLYRDTYLAAFAAALARQHGPYWSWRHLRRICRCGSDLPCGKAATVPTVNGGHW
jgi:hypothetical protein